jgi:hypothetical protein
MCGDGVGESGGFHLPFFALQPIVLKTKIEVKEDYAEIKRLPIV